ncbi:PREDICTED: uncharacterized protein LOC106808050 [Priapulus caudatus]|uniref:Uncharacterized protein LOC106808050 n=1 Tax=Priapulus caudatus TaxID=37621 RepID=A0ABM1E1M1_PRICU|nr:PREDICTED: uncharacterized protein LOC106808050 [Priapulus caudatus]
MVIISFEGGIRLSEYNHLYQQIFKKVNAQRRREPRVNPNGCPIRGTFFVSHDYTDYAVVQSLYHEGHEIAAHSISKRLPSDWWANATLRDWTEEMADERTILRNLAKVNVRDVKGMRTPYLQMGGNTQFKMMQENGFLYDASMPTIQNNPALWPYTLDYLSTQECTVPPCPHSSFPGVWEVPIVDLFDKMGWKCNQVDQCLFPTTRRKGARAANGELCAPLRDEPRSDAAHTASALVLRGTLQPGSDAGIPRHANRWRSTGGVVRHGGAGATVGDEPHVGRQRRQLSAVAVSAADGSGAAL